MNGTESKEVATAPVEGPPGAQGAREFFDEKTKEKLEFIKNTDYPSYQRVGVATLEYLWGRPMDKDWLVGYIDCVYQGLKGAGE